MPSNSSVNFNPVEIPPNIREIYPFAGQWVEIQGRRMHYLDEGPDASPKTILLLHGNPTWSFLYRQIIPRVSPYCRTVAPDYLGMGFSEKVHNERWHTLENHTRTITEFINKLGLKNIILVVQDWAGPIGLGYALDNPDNVAGMLIMNTWAGAKPSRFHASVLPWRMMHAPFIGPHLLLRVNVLIRRGIYLSTVRSRPRLKGGPVLAGYCLPYSSPLDRIAILAFPRNIPLKPGDLNWDRLEKIKDGLKNLTFPCRLLWGEKDIVFPPSNAAVFQKLLPHCSEPRMIADGGHFIQEDAPEEIAEEILTLLEQR